MKLKAYSLRLIVVLTTFTLGVGLFNAGENIKLNTSKLVVVNSQLQSEIFVPTITEDSLQVPQNLAVKLNEDAEYEFSADGDYYIFSYGTEIEQLLQAFKSFNEISIKTANYENASKENNYQGIPIPPEGYISTDRNYKFTRINIANRQIAFETEVKKGISYKSVGEFTDYLKSPNVDFDLQGNLIKMRNGKKIGELKIKLVAGGC